jgi:hypothetical protein
MMPLEEEQARRKRWPLSAGEEEGSVRADAMEAEDKKDIQADDSSALG